MRAIIVAVFLLMGGCAVAPADGLPDNVRLSAPENRMGSTMQMVDSIIFEREGAPRQSPARCAALHMSNGPVMLEGGHGYYGYSIRAEGGGDTIEYADAQGAVVARGTAEYTAGSLVRLPHAVRFKAVIESNGSQTLVQLRDIESAQLSTGSLANSGFSPLGSWRSAGVLEAYAAMKSQVDAVLDCMYSTTLVERR